MLIEELRVKISAEMGSLENVLNQIKSDMGTLTKKCSEAEGQVRSMNKSATSGMGAVKDATKTAQGSINKLKTSFSELTDLYDRLGHGDSKVFDIDVAQTRKSYQAAGAELKKLEEQYDNISEKMNEMFMNDEHASNNSVYRQLAQELASVDGKIRTTQETMSRFNAQLSFENPGKGIIKTNQEIELLKRRAYDAGVALKEAREKLDLMATKKEDFGTEEFYQQQTQVAELTKTYEALVGKVHEAQQAFKGEGKSSFFNALKAEFPQLQTQIDNVKLKIGELWASFKNSTKVGQIFTGIVSAMKTTANLVSGLAKDLVKPFVLIGPYAAKAGKAIAVGFGKGVQAISAITSKAGELMGKMNPLTAICKRLGKSFSTLGSKIKTAFIYSAVNSFFKDIKEKVTDWINSNEQMKSSLSQLRGAWTTAFAPAVEAIIPILQKICAWATSAAQAFAQLISVITGKAVSTFKATAEGMENAAKASDDMGASAGGAGDAAEEAQKQLAGFDELEVMQDKNSSGGGGVDTSEAANSLADLMDGDKFATWGEAFNAMLDKIIGKLPLLDTACQKAAQGVNWLSSHLLEMFTYTGVEDKISTIATSIANSFNKLFDGIDWNQLGQAVGAGLQLIITFIHDFFYTFDWAGLGKSIAQFINGAFEKIDFVQLGETLVTKFNMIWQTIEGFVTNLDWNQVGNKIGDALNGIINGVDLNALATSISEGVKGIFTAIKTALDKVDTEALKNKIKEFFENIDWGGMFNSIIGAIESAIAVILPQIGTIISGLLDAVFQIISETDWAQLIIDICGSVAQALEDMDIGLILEKVGAIVLTVISAIPEIVVAAVAGIADILASIFSSLGCDTIAGFFSGISDALKDIANWLKTNVFEPVTKSFKNLFGIHSPSTVFNGFGQDLINGLKEGIADTWGKITSFFSEKFEALKSKVSTTWEEIKTKTSTTWENIKQDMSTKITTIKTNAETSWNTLKTNITNTTNALKSNLSTAWTNIKSDITTKVSTMKSTVENYWTSLKTNVGNTANTLKSNLGTTFTNIKNDVETKIKNMKSEVEGKISTLKTTVKDDFENMKSNITTKMNTAKSNAVSAFTNLKNSIDDILDGLKEIVRSAFNWISNKVSAIWDKVTEGNDAKDQLDNDSGSTVGGPGAAKMASGGVVTKPTLTWVGEYPGASSNPEIVTPQNLLTSIITNGNNELIDIWLQTTRQIISAIEDKDMDVRIDDSAIAGSVVRANIASIRKTGTPLLT